MFLSLVSLTPNSGPAKATTFWSPTGQLGNPCSSRRATNGGTVHERADGIGSSPLDQSSYGSACAQGGAGVTFIIDLELRMNARRRWEEEMMKRILQGLAFAIS